MASESDGTSFSAPTGTPSFDHPRYVEVEPGEAFPEEFLARISNIELIEVSRYHEPEVNLAHSHWHVDPYTEVEAQDEHFHLILRVSLQIREDSLLDESGDVLELAAVTIRFIFYIPKIETYITEEEETEISIPGPALAEMLRTAYDGTRGAWCTEMASSRYGDVLLPHTNVEKLMQDFFGASMPSSSGS